VKTNFNNYREKFTIYAKGENIPHSNLMNMFNDSLIYISNNLSDGMPNTLLEAISNGAFPIQSNPGGASEEIITHGENGLLIEDCEDIEEIKERILTALQSPNLIDKAFEKNMELRKKLDYEHIRKQVLEKYELVEKELLC
jgi:glycosyltransferase involved in cell wall biosynthesis